jgi:hypothetical protein
VSSARASALQVDWRGLPGTRDPAEESQHVPDWLARRGVPDPIVVVSAGVPTSEIHLETVASGDEESV